MRDSLSQKSEKPKEECGLMAVTNSPNACSLVALGLQQLQHRGQQGAGCAAWENGTFHVRRGAGLVMDVFDVEGNTSMLAGTAAIGHVRYSTAGGTGVENIQPFTVQTDIGDVAFAHNGNLTNSDIIKEKLLGKGYGFVAKSDTEVALNLFVSLTEEKDFILRLIKAFSQLQGAFSFLAMADGKIAAVRDPYGMRPLVMGRKDDGWVFASETTALNKVRAEYVRDIKPGEIVIAETGKFAETKSYFLPAKAPERFCVFEYIYFMRPDSMFGGRHAREFRRAIGREVAKEFQYETDVVVPVPDSGIPAAEGVAEQLSVPYCLGGIQRGHYSGRSFIAPTAASRKNKTEIKLSADSFYLNGKRVALVDDSIVRGTTAKNIVELVRRAGAKEVHFISACPMIKNPCFFGVDMRTRKELICCNYDYDLKKIAGFLGADTVSFASVDALYRAFDGFSGRDDPRRFTCDACMTDEYEVPVFDPKKVAIMNDRTHVR